MSLFRPASVKCPNCEHPVLMEAVGSVNADRRPDLRQSIINSSFQDVTCGECKTVFRLEPTFNFLDVGRSQWIAAMPARQLPDFLEIEAEVQKLFEDSYGATAPRPAQEIGKGLDLRLTFGWPALREKLLLKDLGLDDVLLEMMKLDLMRRLPQAPFESGVEMRVTGREDDTLSLSWIRADTEETLSGITLSIALYRNIEANAEAWAPVRASLVAGPFVDMQRTYLGEGRTAAE
jgi:hypothetical protein